MADAALSLAGRKLQADASAVVTSSHAKSYPYSSEPGVHHALRGVCFP